MGLLDRLLECDRHDLRDFRPLWIENRRHGWVRPPLMRRLLAAGDIFRPAAGGVAIDGRLDSYAARSEAVHDLLLALRAEGLVTDWWDEPCPVLEAWHRPPVMQIERAGLDLLGLKSFGVHLNGFVRTEDGIELWIARRALDKASFPGLLDHLAAGGQPLGMDLRENMVKESGEEAGVPPDLAADMVPAGALRYRCDLPEGLNDDCIFVFDLEVPEDFEPKSEDGEVESFVRMGVAEVVGRLRTTREFKFNVGPVILDFLLRHDLLPVDDPEYAAVRTRLETMRRP